MSSVCNSQGIVNSWGLGEYAPPELESAPQFSLRTYPQPYPQAGQGVGVRADRRQRTPPHLSFARGVSYTPQQKIFAKVKAAI